MVKTALKNAIKSDLLRLTLKELNEHFYNRKHECQIRDAILRNINESKRYRGLSEYPRGTSSYSKPFTKFTELKKNSTQKDEGRKGSASVDLTLFNHSNKPIAAIEFKHHFPKDLGSIEGKDLKRMMNDRLGIISDMTRSVSNFKTTHFVLILQGRQIPDHSLEKIKRITKNTEEYLVSEDSKCQPLGPIKYWDRNDDISTKERLQPYLKELENDMKRYGVKFNSDICTHKVEGRLIRSTYQFVIYEL